MSYRGPVSPQAAEAFNKLPEQARVAISPHLKALAEAPLPHNSKPLRSNLRGWRSLRVGDYRIGYIVAEKERTVRIRMVADRRDFHDILARISDS
jgi:mRNA-degrading endonuclease RelE of RelBE toxin-antitoxin system